MKVFHSLVARSSRGWATVLFVLLTGAGLFAQALGGAQVPAAAASAFAKAQPGINPTWVAGPSGSFEAQFMRDGSAQVYAYDQAGVLQTKKIKTALTTLPVTVQRSIDAGYAGSQVEAAYKVMTRSQEKYYEVQLAQAGKRERLRYNLEGQPIGKTSLAPSESAAASKPALSPAIASASKPAPATPTTKPAAPKPAPTTMAMRGESAPAPSSNEEDLDDLMDDKELDDLLEEEEEEFDPIEEEEDDLLEEDEDWEEIEDDDL